MTPFALALLLYYAYNGGESYRAFAALATANPTSAMAYWGEALAAGPDLNTPMTPERFARGQTAIAKAVALEANATPRERSMIDAMALRFKGTYADWDRDDDAYANAMARLALATGDPDARVLAAEVALELQRKPAAKELIDAELAADPANVMANHLCIHYYDQVPDRTPAIPCAQRLDAMSFPPAAEHLAHMPAHTWIETGEYAKALASSERAYTLFEAYKQNANRDPAHDQLELHDVGIGYSAAMMLGNYAEAKVWSDRYSAAADLPLGAYTALRFGRNDLAYGLTHNGGMADTAVSGYAALRLGKLDEAASDAKALGATRGWTTELFLARLAEAQGKTGEAERRLQELAKEQREMFAGEQIPDWPALEALGGLELRGGNDAKAAAAFTADLAAYPQDPRALYGLSLALDKLGKSAEAADARARFQQIWAGADTTLTLDDL